MANLILKAEIRDLLGKKVKNLRTQGKIPAVLYGKDFKNLHLAINMTEFERVLVQAGTSTIVDLEIEGNEPAKILLHEPQHDAVTEQILHADLYKVNMKEEIRTEIPLEFVGSSAAVDELEGNLITNKDALEVKCLPGNLVSSIKVDISALKTFEDIIKLSDLGIPEGIEVLADSEEIIAQVTPPRSEEELEAMEEEAAADQEKAGIENIEAQAEAAKAEGEGEEAAKGEAPAEASGEEKDTAKPKNE